MTFYNRSIQSIFCLLLVCIFFHSSVDSASAQNAGDKEATLARISKAAESNKVPNLLLKHVPRLRELLRDPGQSEQAIEVSQRVIDVLKENIIAANTLSGVEVLSRGVADAYFELGLVKEQHQTLEEWEQTLQQNFVLGGNDQKAYGRRFDHILLDYLRTDQLEKAFELMQRNGMYWTSEGVASRESGKQLAGALYRRLDQLSAQERFDLMMEWTFVEGTPKKVRILNRQALISAPPAGFARLLGERPNENAFPIPHVGVQPGLFSTAWELRVAAEECGRMKELRDRVAELQSENLQRNDPILHLQCLTAAESEWLANDKLLQSFRKQPSLMATVDDIVIAAALFEIASSRPLAIEYIRLLKERMAETSSPLKHTLNLVYDRMTTRFDAIGNAREFPERVNLRHWLHAGSPSESQGLWFGHEDHLFHYYGINDEELMLKYPVRGDFEFECESLFLGPEQPQGHLAYDNRLFIADLESRSINVRERTGDVLGQSSFHFVHNRSWATFQRMSLKRQDGRITFAVNGHPAWEGLGTSNFPWLSLTNPAGETSLFRGLQWKQMPNVPDEVKLITNDSVVGWNEGAKLKLGNTTTTLPQRQPQPSFFSRIFSREEQPEWSASDGTLIAHDRQRETGDDRAAEFTYVRPLATGETFQFEFLHDADEIAIHPILGPFAFLLSETGVTLHWRTDGNDWTGLLADNQLLEPLNRRGPRLLPLRKGDWNVVSVQLDQEVVKVTLNETLVYERKWNPLDSTRFGFLYEDRKPQAAASVRNVVLRGEWSEQFEDISSDRILEPDDESFQQKLSPVLGELANERHVDDATFYIYRLAMEMAVQQRYELLKQWVLPSREHETFRLNVNFSPTDPPPVSRYEKQNATGRRVGSGGEFIALAKDLVYAAKETGQLDELEVLVKGVSTEEEVQQRCRIALLALIAKEQGNVKLAREFVEQLTVRVEEKVFPAFRDRWPETLVVGSLYDDAELKETVSDLATRMVGVHIRQQGINDPPSWERQVIGWADQCRPRQVDLMDWRTIPELTTSVPPKHWSMASHSFSWSRALGMPQSQWNFFPGGARKQVGHDFDYLYYHIPLIGNFEVECDLSGFGWRETHLMYGGKWVGPYHTLEYYEMGNVRGDVQRISYKEDVAQYTDWIRYRLKVQDGQVKVWFNGHLVHERILSPDDPPWLSIRTFSFANGEVRDLRITGKPEVPAEVNLSKHPDLNDWVSYAHSPVGSTNGKWQHENGDANSGMITSSREDYFRGQAKEEMLYYQRPMLEDGVISYRFYYEEGETEIYPALDRKVFLLSQEGVKIHWQTDLYEDQTTMSPLNLYEDREGNLLDGELPLQKNAWNDLEFRVDGNEVEIGLNGEKIYRSEIEPTNQRYFGLFHYSDRTSAQVKDIVWRGEWPRTIEQSALALANLEVTRALELAEELPIQYEHDFAKQGYLNADFSRYDDKDDIEYEVAEQGVRQKITSKSLNYGQTYLSPKIRMQGDFDIIAEFAGLKLERSQKHGAAGIALQVILNDEFHSMFGTTRHVDGGANDRPNQIVQGDISHTLDPNFPGVIVGKTAEECTSGKLRLTRIGDELFYFLSESDSPIYRLVGRRAISTADSLPDGIRLRGAKFAESLDPVSCEVIWKRLTIRAESAIDDQNQ